MHRLTQNQAELETATLTKDPARHAAALLMAVEHAFQRGDIDAGLAALYKGLETIRRSASPSDWSRVCKLSRMHPVGRASRQDPLTERAFAKPRGYAGDAVMLDFIYGVGRVCETLRAESDLGRQIADFTVATAPCHSARARRHLAAELIDVVGHKNPGSHVLALACGHLREADVSWALRNGKIGRMVAFDQDEDSLAVVREDYGAYGIEAQRGSVRDVLQGTARLAANSFDLVYSMGLYDYLNDDVAVQLTNQLLQLTAPGGSVVIANFAPNIAERGYMEALMDWQLIYRDTAQMTELADRLNPEHVGSHRVWRDRFNCVVYLEVTRKANLATGSRTIASKLKDPSAEM